MDLAADQLSVRYDRALALDSVSFALRRGARLFLGGLAGSGKTTLLKALAGLLRPVSGRVLWGGQALAALGSNERRALQGRIAMVFQTDALFDSMTVLQNVMLPLSRRKVAQAEAERRAREILAAVGLEIAAQVRPEHLSGGMKKRAGLARALAPSPEVLLCDDPLAGLDPRTAAQVCALIDAESQGRTLVIAAPEPPGDLGIDRWVWLERGRLAYDGEPRPALLAAPPDGGVR